MDQFSTLNTNLTRLNNILYTPLTGGPTVQAGKARPEFNVFKKGPAFLASITPEEEETLTRPDYNMNGFVLTSFDNIIDSGPKEPVLVSPYIAGSPGTGNLVLSNKAANDNTEREEKIKFLLDISSDYPDNQKWILNSMNWLRKTFSETSDDGPDENDIQRSDDNMYTQNTIPFIVEKYIRIEPYDALIDIDTNEYFVDPAVYDVAEKMKDALYSSIDESSGFGDYLLTDTNSVFTGPVGLSNLAMYLQMTGFFNNLSSAEKSTSLNRLFKSVKFGLRLKIILADEIPTTFGGALSSNNFSSSEKFNFAKEKCFHPDHGWTVPLFVEEMDLPPVILLSTLENSTGKSDYFESLDKTYTQELMDRMVCQPDYKVFLTIVYLYAISCLLVRYIIRKALCILSARPKTGINTALWHLEILDLILLTIKTYLKSHAKI